jgi:hypothetical protein
VALRYVNHTQSTQEEGAIWDPAQGPARNESRVARGGGKGEVRFLVFLGRVSRRVEAWGLYVAGTVDFESSRGLAIEASGVRELLHVNI